MSIKIQFWREGSEYRASPADKPHLCVRGNTLIEAVGRLVVAKGRQCGIRLEPPEERGEGEDV